jgi:hypothetical protein
MDRFFSVVVCHSCCFCSDVACLKVARVVRDWFPASECSADLERMFEIDKNARLCEVFIILYYKRLDVMQHDTPRLPDQVC